MKKKHIWVIEVKEKKGGPFLSTVGVAFTKLEAKKLRNLEWMPDEYLHIVASRVTKYEAIMVRK
jgi:hypothetical protein